MCAFIHPGSYTYSIVFILCILLCEDFPLPPFHGSEIIDNRDDLEINPLAFSRLFPLKPKRCFRDTCQ